MLHGFMLKLYHAAATCFSMLVFLPLVLGVHAFLRDVLFCLAAAGKACGGAVKLIKAVQPSLPFVIALSSLP